MSTLVPKRTRLGDLIVGRGVSTAGQVNECLAIQQRHRQDGVHTRLGELLVKKGYAPRQEVLRLLSEQKRRNGEYSRLGNYRLLRRLGKGGMGAVYLARHLETGGDFALKVLDKELAAKPNFLNRFQREARVMMDISHPHVVRAYEFGHDRGYHFLAMEYVPGENLQQRIKSCGKMTERDALFICRQIGEALEYAWERGVVHRDIKPENILLTPDGVAKLTDMGLAIVADQADLRCTQTGVAIGTPLYISPEQARGEKQLDIRCDIYALGASLYHMVAGEPPFRGRTPAVLIAQHLTRDVPDPRTLNPTLSGGTTWIILKAMQKRQEERYQTPAELLEDIRRASRGLSGARRLMASTAPAAQPVPTASAAVPTIVETPSAPAPVAEAAPAAPAVSSRHLPTMLLPEHRNVTQPPQVPPAVRHRPRPQARGSGEGDVLGSVVRALLIVAALMAVAIWLGVIRLPQRTQGAADEGPRPPQRPVPPSRVTPPGRQSLVSGPVHAAMRSRDVPQRLRLILQNGIVKGSERTWMRVAQIAEGPTLSTTVNPEVRAGYTVGWLEGARRRLLLSTPVFSQQWPETLEIREAHLEMACYEAIDCQDAPLELYRLKRAWAPLGCTWHRADASGNQRWQTDGAGGSQDRGASCEDATRITARFERGDGLLWVRWDITDVAREWVAGAPNHGLLLESSGAEQSGEAWPDANYFARFHPTHDSDHNSNPQLRPRLVILVERR